MTTTINAAFNLTASASKGITTTDPTASSPGTQMNLGSYQQNFNAATTPNGLDCWSGHVALSGGVATIDLTSVLQVSLNVTFNGTGLKLRYFEIVPDSTNVNPIQVGTGATNGYGALGVQSAMNAGDIRFGTTTGATAVGSTNKTLDFAGTGTQGCEVLLVFGS